MATHSPGSRPLVSLFGDIISDISHLFQTEIRLARAELNEKLGRVANAGTLLAAGIVLSLAGLFVLLLAVVELLALAGLPRHWGLLGVGALAGLVGVALLGRAAGSLKGEAFIPTRTLEQVQQDISVVKEQVR